jgi:hypothetical protein
MLIFSEFTDVFSTIDLCGQQEVKSTYWVVDFLKKWFQNDETSFYRYIYFYQKTLDQKRFMGIHFQENKHVPVKTLWAW